jgi:flavoprotein
MNTIRKAMLIAATVLSLSSCGADLTINGNHYDTFGIANEEANRDPRIVYEISAGSVIWAILLCETVVVPVYIIGWDLWQPVRAK